MKRSAVFIAWASLLSVSGSMGTAFAQITANEGDGVLNAPYRGTITSLRECSADIAYGEVKNHVEPTSSGVFITSSTISVWVEGTWDRSVLRMYEGVDASGNEIDLTGTSQFSPETVFTDADDIKRFSFKAMGTKTLAPQTFTVRLSFTLQGSPVNPTRTITVAPITGSTCALPGESEAFLPGTPILDVAAGDARLTVPVGRTAEMIGAAFSFRDRGIGPSTVETSDVLFPGAAESVFIQNIGQFRLSTTSLGPNKTAWGTPWPGHLVGLYNSSDVFGPEGTHYDTPSGSTDGLFRFNYVRPLRQSESHPASLQYVYDNSLDNRVIEIRDHATPPNVITLVRTAGVVIRITTSDGRGWNLAHNTDGWITEINPDGGKGKRYFTYNSAGRVTQVKDANNNVMYEFVYVNDPGGKPTILAQERRLVDGVMRTVVEHEVVSEGLQRRKEYVESGVYRQFDFAYDTANGLKHRLASITSYQNVNGSGAAFTTTYTHEVNNPTGSMVITQMTMPDGSTVSHEYDAHIGPQAVDFGFRTKSTRTGPDDGSLVTFDATYEFFYTSGGTRLFFSPRMVKQRDGRGAISEVTLDYDNGGQYVDNLTEVQGQDLNRLLSITGPVINTGPSAPRTPRTRFVYGAMSTTNYWLQRSEVDYASGLVRATDYGYDALLRLTTRTVDPGGENIVTRLLYCDMAATQDRIAVDADGYWTRTRFDNDGRVTATERFLNVNAGNLGDPCADPAGPVYRTTNIYDTSGRLQQQTVENKDQDGVSLIPATITTTFGYDSLGRLELQTVDPGGVGQESHFDYNWLGEIERQFDTSGRGTNRTYDGRGLVKFETPLALDETPDANLTTTFAYDAMGNLRFTNRPAGTVEERVYDDFDRLKQIRHIPGPDGGNTITTSLEYDAANNVTRTVVDEAAAVLSDSTARYDEGGSNYESRRRTVAAADNANDPLTQRKFDWIGNVIEEKSLGDATVADRVITTEYDGANRVRKITDNLGGETTFARDDRGNVLDQTVKIDASNFAVTTTIYDALSRAIQITSPEDGDGGRPDRIRRYDSRGNLLRETIRDASDVPRLSSVFGYDNAGRQTRRAVLASATSTIIASAASVTADRVTDFVYDADGRLEIRRTYNNNSATPLETTTTHDDLGRLDQVTDPSGSYTDEDYADNGRLSQRVVFDGVGTRTFTFGYDGHDRIKRETAVGTPDLVTTFTLDGLDRQKRIIDPQGIATRTDFDLVGRRMRLVEDDTGALQRQTDFAYNRLDQLITQTAKNKTGTGSPLADQVTTYRYDSLGRQTRVAYPDSTQHADPINCTDCVRQTFDLAGRVTQSLDQRGLTTTFTYDDRGLLLTRIAGTDRDTFAYDAAGRITLADRGTTVDQDAVAHSAMGYTDLGNLDSETQVIAGGAPRTVDYDYDQAGNRKQLTYPGGEVLAYTPTVLNQVYALDLNGSPLLDYLYHGRLLDKRRTITTAPGGNAVYEYDVGYDSHRRVSAVVNRFQPGGGNAQTVAAYGFTHDNNGNPLTQTATEGMAGFVADDRAFTVDRLNRLTRTDYFENGQIESDTLDLVGNRESHTDRAGSATAYGPVNAANEYSTIGGSPVTYDAAGNLIVDANGRQYSYDEHNRLRQVKSATNVVLANYTYDALGRRVTFNDPVAGLTTRYYYDGRSVIEERNGADARVRYYVNGSQYVDERVVTYTELTTSRPEPPASAGVDIRGTAMKGKGEPPVLAGADLPLAGVAPLPSREGSGDGHAAAGSFTYYLPGLNFSIAGTGNADGSSIQRLDYSSTGDFAGGGPGPSGYYHDVEDDLDLDLRDFASFQNCFDPSPPVPPACLAAHDFDDTGVSDGLIDLDDYARFWECFRGPFVTPGQSCGQARRRSALPASGTFAMHGRPVDVLSDGLVLQDFRARTYLPTLGRWLQRDPLRYGDGPSLYEAFRSNAMRFTDPFGRQVEEPGVLESFIEFLRRLQTGADPFTGEDLIDKTLRRAGAVAEPNPARRALLEQIDLYEEAAFGTIQAAEPVVARGVGVIQVAGGMGEAGTGVVLVVVSEGFGAVPGTIFVLHGVDVTQAGVRQVISGRFTPTETYATIAGAGYPTTAIVVDMGISLSSGLSAAGLAVEASIPFRVSSSAARIDVVRTRAALTSEFPAVTSAGEVNLLNVVRRGTPLTTEELSLLYTVPVVDPPPVATQYFRERIIGDLLRYGRLRGRLGNIETRVATVKELILAEFRGLRPQTELRIPGAGPGTRGSVYVDIALFAQTEHPVEFVQLVRSKIPAYELRNLRIIQQAYPNVPIRFVIVGKQ